MIKVSGISYSWQKGDKEIIKDLNLSVETGEFVSVLGPSGCGKSTVLKLMAGILIPDEGEITIDAKTVHGISRTTGFVFQEYSLFPWLTVLNNVRFGPKMTLGNKRIDQKAIREILSKVGLWKERNKYPYQLSGGMKQRTAIARVLASNSSILLMDEPFGALDYHTRREMQLFIKSIWREFKKTIVFVTHNIDEAILLSDRILLLNPSNSFDLIEIEVDLERPRKQSTSGFTDLRNALISLISQKDYE